MAQPIRSIAIVAIALCGHLASAAANPAQQIWRCGSTYTDQPCKGGKAVDAGDPRSEADRRAADAASRRTQTEATQMKRARLKQDKDAADRDRKSAAEARRNALAERRLAATERLQQARIRKLDREPRKSTAKFKGRENPSL